MNTIIRPRNNICAISPEKYRRNKKYFSKNSNQNSPNLKQIQFVNKILNLINIFMIMSAIIANPKYYE